MRAKMSSRPALSAIAALVISAGWLASAQYGGPPVSNPLQGQISRQQSGYDVAPDRDPVSAEKRMRALNVERHKSMVSDTEKLVKLARQLDVEIASNPSDELTPQELQKVATIEKLAHNVKTKMAQSYGGGPEFKPMIPIGGPGAQ